MTPSPSVPPSPVMQAGRELDERVAIEVMGWNWMRADKPQILPPHRWLVPPEEYGDWGHVRPADMTEPMEDRWWLRSSRECTAGHTTVPHYSSDIAAAWLVVARMAKLGWNVDLRVTFDGFVAEFDNLARTYTASVDPRDGEMPLAICLAALAAVVAPGDVTP